MWLLGPIHLLLDVDRNNLTGHGIFLDPRGNDKSLNVLWSSEPDAGKDRRQEEKGMTEDEMVGWHHRLNGLEFEQALGNGEGQEGSLACCSSWGHKESDMTEQLNKFRTTNKYST